MQLGFGSADALRLAIGVCIGALAGCAAKSSTPAHTELSPMQSAAQPAGSEASAATLRSAGLAPSGSAASNAGSAAMRTALAPAAAEPPDDAAAHITAAPFVGSSLDSDTILKALSQSELSALRPVGSTSTVFRSQLDAPFRAAFKAATQRRPLGPVAEVAAYRLARCLGLDNVPPAVLRRVPVSVLQQQLDAEFVRQWPRIAPRLLTEHDGSVEGAAIFWIEGLRKLDLASPSVRAGTQRVLSLSEPLPDPPPPLAAGLSSLLAFDYLIGNWDRWSGGNVKGDATGQILYARDQDAAFGGRLSEPLQRRLLDPVLATERFSRQFVQRLRALTRSAYHSELARDAVFAERPRLDERSLARLFDRRATLLSHVNALIEERGEQRVLAFP